MVRFKASAFLAMAVALWCAGCSDSKNVPVSGRVLVDGKPKKDLIVLFQPIGGEGNPNPGKGSSGRTDVDGRYTLSVDDKTSGAVVGKQPAVGGLRRLRIARHLCRLGRQQIGDMRGVEVSRSLGGLVLRQPPLARGDRQHSLGQRIPALALTRAIEQARHGGVVAHDEAQQGPDKAD